MEPASRPAPNPGSNGGDPIKDEPPPFLGRWSRVYTLVLIELALLILAFYLFTVHFAP
jgi:hypothetical protein